MLVAHVHWTQTFSVASTASVHAIIRILLSDT